MNNVFGLDIGTRNVVGTVGYQTDDKEFVVTAQYVREHETRAMLDGQIHDIGRVAKTIKEVKDELEKQTGQPLEEVCIAAAGRVLKTVTTHVEYEYAQESVVTGEDVHTLDLLGIEKAQEALKEVNDTSYKFYCVGYSTVKFFLNDEVFISLEGHKANKIGEDIIVTFLPEDVVDGLYAAQILKFLEGKCRKAVKYVFPAGEEHKNLDTVRGVYRFLIEEGFDRKDMLLALGGGVCGDLTGFVAATYLRGIDFVQIPTTLLAQADSSIGGKTGVDFDSYKNMVGAFKMPRLVYMNLSVLKTLEERQFYSGFAEVMKSALIKDAPFYEWLIENMYEICERDLNTLEEMVIRTCSIKKMVVEKDPTEQGDRALLNLGHTIGHAIEKYKNFELYHGECVALGTVAAAYISWKKEMLSMEEFYEIRDMFVPFYLPISVDDIDPQEILKLTKSDKKMEAGTIKFILLKKIGKAVIDRTVTDEEILAAIEEINFSEEDAHE